MAMQSDGRFIVAWASTGEPGDASGYAVVARQFNADGSPVGNRPEVRLSTETVGNQWRPSIACDAAGNYVAVWEQFETGTGSAEISMYRFNADGSQLGTFTGNQRTVGSQEYPAVAVNNSGQFIVAWASDEAEGVSDGSLGKGVAFRIFNLDATTSLVDGGSGVGGENTANTVFQGTQQAPAVAFDDLGRFIIAWESQSSADDDDSDGGVYYRRYALEGTTPLIIAKDASEIRGNVTLASNQIRPQVALGGAGRYLLTWCSFAQDEADGFGVFLRQIPSIGNPDTAEMPVNVITARDQGWAMGGLKARWELARLPLIQREIIGLRGTATIKTAAAPASTQRKYSSPWLLPRWLPKKRVR